jgi:hypothetical protein
VRLHPQLRSLGIQAICLLALTEGLKWVWKWSVKLFENAVLGWADDRIAEFIIDLGPTVTHLFDWAPPLLLASLSLWVFERFYLRQLPYSRPQTGAIPLREIFHPKTKWHQAWLRTIFPPTMMDMPDAARELADALRGLKFADYMNSISHEPAKQLDLLAHYLVNTSIPVFARYENGANLIEINKENFKNGAFTNAGTTFVKHGMMGVPFVIDISIRRRELRKAIAEVKLLDKEFSRQTNSTGGPTVAAQHAEYDAAFAIAAMSKNDARKELWKLRKEGVAIRNESVSSEQSFSLWKQKYETWRNNVLEVADKYDENLRNRLEVLDRPRPPPSLPVVNADHGLCITVASEILLRIDENLPR